jgi:hypothetical protein
MTVISTCKGTPTQTIDTGGAAFASGQLDAQAR